MLYQSHNPLQWFTFIRIFFPSYVCSYGFFSAISLLERLKLWMRVLYKTTITNFVYNILMAKHGSFTTTEVKEKCRSHKHINTFHRIPY